MRRSPLFSDRSDAGRALADALGRYRGRSDVLVLALPRGGVPVAAEIARALNAPLDVFLVRKLGVPGHEELAMGALTSGGAVLLNADVVDRLRIPKEDIAAACDRERLELERRERLYRQGRPAPELRGRTVILVDDGLATGATMRAAARAVRKLGPERVVVAVPVGAEDTCELLAGEVDEVVCLATPRPFVAVGQWYRSFEQTGDDEVTALLRRTGVSPTAGSSDG